MNLAELKKRIKESREFEIAWNDFALKVRRPTQQEVYAMMPGRKDSPEDNYHSMVQHYKQVFGWQGVTEAHLIDGANGIAVDYDIELLPELLDRNPGLGDLIITRMYEEIEKHTNREEQEKKT